MSHFSTILENLRMVAIKRSPLTQQKQKQQQQTVTPTPTSPQQQQQHNHQHLTSSSETAATKSCNNDELLPALEQDVKINNANKQIKVFISKQPPTPQSPEAPPTSNTATTTPQCTKSSPNHNNEQQTDKSTSISAGTPDKKPHQSSHHGHKRQSISARGSIGSTEHTSAKNSPGRERNRGNSGNSNVIVEIDGGAPGGSTKNSASSRGSRELSPTPKNQQRKMSTDFRSRAGSFIHLDEEGRSILMRKPVRLKNIEGRPEVYDTLHFKGREVSVLGAS